MVTANAVNEAAGNRRSCLRNRPPYNATGQTEALKGTLPGDGLTVALIPGRTALLSLYKARGKESVCPAHRNQREPMALTELIYVSSMAGALEHELGAILESAVRHNQRNGITGMLLYYRGGFMQVLEGGEVEVQDTYARICSDKRHRDLFTLSLSEIPFRHFANWSMGYKYIDASVVAKFPKHAPFFNFRVEADRIKGVPGLGLEMLTMFSNGMKLDV
jgi:hypothetical protein